MGKFKQLSLCERTIIETYLNDGKTATFIAEKAKVNKSSIIREIRKNRIKRRESLCKIQCICTGCINTTSARSNLFARVVANVIVRVVQKLKTVLIKSFTIAAFTNPFRMCATLAQKRIFVQKSNMNMMP